MLAEGFLCVCVHNTLLAVVADVHVAEAVLERSRSGEGPAGEFAEEGAVGCGCFCGCGHFDIFFPFGMEEVFSLRGWYRYGGGFDGGCGWMATDKFTEDAVVYIT